MWDKLTDCYMGKRESSCSHNCELERERRKENKKMPISFPFARSPFFRNLNCQRIKQKKGEKNTFFKSHRDIRTDILSSIVLKALEKASRKNKYTQRHLDQAVSICTNVETMYSTPYQKDFLYTKLETCNLFSKFKIASYPTLLNKKICNQQPWTLFRFYRKRRESVKVQDDDAGKCVFSPCRGVNNSALQNTINFQPCGSPANAGCTFVGRHIINDCLGYAKLGRRIWPIIFFFFQIN